MEYMSDAKKEALKDIFVVWDEIGHVPATPDEFNRSKKVRRVNDIPPAGRVSIAFGIYKNALPYAEKYYHDEEARKEIDPDYAKKKQAATTPPSEEEAPTPAKEVTPAPPEQQETSSEEKRRRGSRRSKAYRQAMEEETTIKESSSVTPQEPQDKREKLEHVPKPADEPQTPTAQPEEPTVETESPVDANDFYEYEEFESYTVDGDADTPVADEAAEEPAAESTEEVVEEPPVEESISKQTEAEKPTNEPEPEPEPDKPAHEELPAKEPQPVKEMKKTMEDSDNKIILNATKNNIFFVNKEDYLSALRGYPPHTAEGTQVQKTGRALLWTATIVDDKIIRNGVTVQVKTTFNRPAMIRNNTCADFPEQKANIFYIVEKEIVEAAQKTGRDTNDLFYPTEYAEIDGIYYVYELGKI